MLDFNIYWNLQYWLSNISNQLQIIVHWAMPLWNARARSSQFTRVQSQASWVRQQAAKLRSRVRHARLRVSAAERILNVTPIADHRSVNESWDDDQPITDYSPLLPGSAKSGRPVFSSKLRRPELCSFKQSNLRRATEMKLLSHSLNIEKRCSHNQSLITLPYFLVGQAWIFK